MKKKKKKKKKKKNNVHPILSHYPLPVKRTVLRRLVKEGSVSSVEKSLRIKTGGRIPVLLSGAIMRDAGKPRGIVCLALDITKRKRAEEAMQKSQALLNATGQMAKVGGWEFDRRTQSLTWTDEVYRIHEVAGDYQPTLAAAIDFYTPESKPVIAEAVRRAIEQGEAFDLELQIVTAKGERRWVHAAGEAHAKDGQIVRVAGTFQDITQRKQAEESLRQSEEQFRAMFEVASIGIAQADPQTGRWLRVNQRMCAITGYSEAEMLQMRVPDITHPEDRQKDWEACQRVVQGRAPDYRIEKRYLRKDGSIIWVNVNMTVIRDAAGQPARTMATIEDITDRKRMDDALVHAKAAAEAANRAKSEFLANMSHEIRTPMTAILGFSDLLASPNLPYQEHREFLTGIQRNGKALLELISDILDLSRIEAEKVTLEKVDCPLPQLIDDVLSVVQVRAEEKGLSLDVDYTFPLPETIHTDPVRLRQILANLIGNAIKFTHRGGVRITLRHFQGTGPSAHVQFAIADTGIGIPADKMGDLFQSFTQLDASASRRYGGTGLGLAISRRLAKALGGDIEAASQLGAGSTFTVTIDAGPLEGTRMLQSAQAVAPARKEPPWVRPRSNPARSRARGGKRPQCPTRADESPSADEPGGRNRRGRPGGMPNGKEVASRGKAVRFDLDGHSDAEKERLRSHTPAPSAGMARSDRGLDRPCPGGRPREMPASRLRRLPRQAHDHDGTSGHGGAALGPRRCARASGRGRENRNGRAGRSACGRAARSQHGGGTDRCVSRRVALAGGADREGCSRARSRWTTRLGTPAQGNRRGLRF